MGTDSKKTRRVKSAPSKKDTILVPDTSVVAEGLVTKYLKEGKLQAKKIIIHQAVLNELEHQANQGRESGFVGLKEIKKLRETCKDRCEVSYEGSRPGEFEIRHAHSGAVDDMIRDLAQKHGGTLMTADRVQALTAEAMGIDVELIRFIHEAHESTEHDPLGKFFTDDTMSVHFKEGSAMIRKRGKPGEWTFEKTKESPDADKMRSLADSIVEAAHARRDGFVEIERKGSTIVQLGRYRIVITKPPFSSAWEVTAVRPVAHLGLKDYDFPDKFRNRLEATAEGILVAGAPGEGKSTFAQALGEFYAHKDKIVKTIESPRDLVLPETITQYSATHGSHEELRDVLLLNRPDYTIFDEIRNTQDFLLFADMRLSGVGMIGVVHATSPVDSIQRFIGRVELGMVPQIIDTVVFIKAGGIAKVYSLQMTVKVPHGMLEADLARPVVVVNDFYTQDPEYEIYTYGDQTTVVPVTGEGEPRSAAMKMAEKGLEEYFSGFAGKSQVELVSNQKARVFVPENAIAKIIGKGGKRIQEIEKELGMSIDIAPLSEAPRDTSGSNKNIPPRGGRGNVQWEGFVGKRNITIDVPKDLADNDIELHDGSGMITQVQTSKKGQVKITLSSPIGKRVRKAMERDQLEVIV